MGACGMSKQLQLDVHAELNRRLGRPRPTHENRSGADVRKQRLPATGCCAGACQCTRDGSEEDSSMTAQIINLQAWRDAHMAAKARLHIGGRSH